MPTKKLGDCPRVFPCDFVYPRANQRQRLGDLTEPARKLRLGFEETSYASSAERWRYENRCQLFWSTFYARDYSALDFLRKIALQLQINCVNQYGNPLGGSIADSSEFTSAWTIVIDAIIQCLSDPERGRWLFVLDGLEREMGMYADPARQIYNSWYRSQGLLRSDRSVELCHRTTASLARSCDERPDEKNRPLGTPLPGRL